MKRRSETAFVVLKTSLCGLAFGAGMYVGDYMHERNEVGAAAVFNFKQLILSSVGWWIIAIIGIIIFLFLLKQYLKRH